MTNRQAENNNYKMQAKPDVIKAALSVGRQENVYEKEIWNAAIEAAALKIESFVYYRAASNEIRKLKK